MRSPDNALKKAAKSLLSALGSPVFDSVPKGHPYPYIVLAEIENKPWNTKTTDGVESFFTIKVASDYTGSKAADEIGNAVIEKMTRGALALDDEFVIVAIYFDNSRIERDGIYYELSITFKTLIYDKEKK